ncbi:MAG: hypothetical protein J2P54_18005, partial [Bradyrhizobiaceae bacterium]|nr:hypothetical protein [Bradyrhizobiaceae bacterium]
ACNGLMCAPPSDKQSGDHSMTDLHLTSEERGIVEAMARDRGKGSRLGFYGSVIVPLLLFAGYGIIQRDFPSMVVALVGLLIFDWWQIWRELSHVNTFKSLCQKVAEHERASDAARWPMVDGHERLDRAETPNA